MNKLTRILFSIGLLNLTLSKVDRWKNRRSTDRLEYVVQHGVYNVRERAIQALGELESRTSIPLLIDALDDRVRTVAIAAANALKRLGTTTEVDQKIAETMKMWTRRQQERSTRLENSLKNKGNSAARWDRPSRKTLENVKEMLRKPMNTGKWL